MVEQFKTKETMKAVRNFILCLLACVVFINSDVALAMDKGLSEDNMIIVDDAYAAISRNKLNEAERLVRIAFKTQPNNYELHMIMADIMEKKQNWSEVVKYLTSIIKAYPNDAYAYASRGFALLNQGATDLALKDLENSQKRGKLKSDMAKNVAIAIENIRVANVAEATEYIEQPSNFGTSEDLWKRAEHYKERDNSDLALKYGRASVKLLPDSWDRNLQMAYLALNYDRDSEAIVYFEKAFSIKEPTLEEGFVYADTFYTYKRLGESKKSLYYLEKAIENNNKKMAKSGKNTSQEDIANNYYLRREHADMTRAFGANTGIYYNRLNDGGYSLQGIQEVYWQPYRSNGRYLQLFATGIETLKSDIYQDGSDTLYAVVGLSIDPSADYNLSLGVDHVFKIGDATEEDTRLRVAHSWDIGSELNPIALNWNYATLFQEYLYAMQNNYSVYTSEIRGGRSFKVSALSNRLVISPHAFVSANYNSLNSQVIIGGKDWDVYAGPGIHFRKWYREDKLNAPKSYLDLVIQYRFAVTSQSDNMLYVVLSNYF